MWWCGRMGSFSSVYSLFQPLPLYPPPFSPPFLFLSRSLTYFGPIQPRSLASAVAWCEIWETYVVFYFRKMISGIECVFFLLLLAVRLWSCPVWFLDDGKEASKCFLSEFHVINLKAWFLSLGPHPLLGPRHNVIYSVTSGKKCTLFILQSVHCCRHAHTWKWPLCVPFTKAILNVVQWRTGGLHTAAHKGKGIHGGEVSLCSALEGQYSSLFLRWEPTMDPVPCKPNSIDPPWGDVQTSIITEAWWVRSWGGGVRRVRLLAKALTESWPGGRWSHLFSVGYNLPYVWGSPVEWDMAPASRENGSLTWTSGTRSELLEDNSLSMFIFVSREYLLN